MNFEDYEMTMPHPQFRLKKPRLLTDMPTRDEFDAYETAMEEYVKGREEYDVKRKAWIAEDRRLWDLFVKDALEELGLTGHPKADLLVSIVRQRHSALTDIFWAMEEMSGLLK